MDQTNEPSPAEVQANNEEKPAAFDDDQKVESSDDSDADDGMPPLEEITKELSAPAHGKNIKGVVTENGSEDEGDELEESSDGWVDILSNGDLRKKVLSPPKEGQGGRPPRGSKVILRVITRLYEPSTTTSVTESGDAGDSKTLADKPSETPTGPVIPDESFDRFSLVIGDNDLHQGLDLLLPLMDWGETARLLIKPRFAYGQPGNKAVGIPEDSTLDMEVELLEIVKYSDDPYGGNPLSGGGEPEPGEPNPIVVEEPLEERLRFGNYKKGRGNFWFERGEYSLAIQCYRGSIRYLDASEDELSQVDRAKKGELSPEPESDQKVNQIEDLVDKRAQAYNNLAATQLKMQNYEAAFRSVEDSLLLRPDNVKALFRRAKIRTEKGDIEEAIEDLKKASRLDPTSLAVTQELDRLNKIMQRQLKEQKLMYRRMMQVKPDEKEDNESNSNNANSNSKSNSTKGGSSKSASSKSKDSSSSSAIPTNTRKGVISKWFPFSGTTAAVSAAGAVAAAVIIPSLYAYLK